VLGIHVGGWTEGSRLRSEADDISDVVASDVGDMRRMEFRDGTREVAAGVRRPAQTTNQTGTGLEGFLLAQDGSVVLDFTPPVRRRLPFVQPPTRRNQFTILQPCCPL